MIKWIKYIDRSYEQIKTRVLDLISTLTPELTDHSDSEPMINMGGIWAGIAEMLGYYIDNSAREAHLATCRKYISAVKIAKSYEYRVQSYLPSSVDVTFVLDANVGSDYVISAGTVVSADGLEFRTDVDLTITTGNDRGTVSATQYQVVTNHTLGSSDGTADQKFSIAANVVDSSVSIVVTAISWTQNTSLAYTLGANEYVQTVGEDAIPIIVFGNDINGNIPANGEDIIASYKTTSFINVGVGDIDTIDTSLTLPAGVTEITVTNLAASSGASAVESLEKLKSRIPKSIRTLDRAVTQQDFIDVSELHAGVSKADVKFECGTNIDIFIVPDGGGLASGGLIASTLAFVEERKVVGRKILVFSAGEITVKYIIDLRVLPQYSAATVVTDVRAALVAFMADRNIRSKVQLSDIYQVIEGVTGVDSSNIDDMRSVPYGRALAATGVLDWDRVITDQSSQTIRWRINMTSSTTYQLLKDEGFVGTFTVGNEVTQSEIVFTLNANSYNTGDQWEFYTYNFYGTLDLIEPSVPISLSGDITINSSGGT